MAIEVELKLAVAPAAVAVLGRSSALRAAARGQSSSKRIHSVYFDTAEHALAQAGISLRLRNVDGAWTQTVKAADPDAGIAGPLQQRFELNTPVRGRVLDVPSLLESPAGTIIEHTADASALAPVFETDFHRITHSLALADGGSCELCVDTGAIRAGDATAEISEIELELDRGSATDLIDFALELTDHVDLRLQPLSKAARGYALVDNRSPQPVKFASPRLDPRTDVHSALRTIISTALAQLLGNEVGLLAAENPGYLHQARVATRRLRVACGLLDRVAPSERLGAVRRELNWLGQILGRARDLDVLDIEMLPPIRKVFPSELGLANFVRHVRDARTQANADVAGAIRSNRYTRCLLEVIRLTVAQRPLADSVERVSAVDFAVTWLERRRRRVAKRGAHIAQLDEPQLHTLRKEVKKLRYMVDCVGSLWQPKRVERYSKRLAALQSALGATHDAVMIALYSRQWRPTAESEEDKIALGLLRGWAAARADEAHDSVAIAWREFKAERPFWRRKHRREEPS